MIADTAALITGISASEIYKIVQGRDKVEQYKNGCVNMALPLIVFSELSPVIFQKSKEYDPISMARVV